MRARMGGGGQRFPATAVALLLLTVSFSPEAMSYVGPGVGVGVLGAIAGTVMAIIALVVGAVWYPLKRLARRLRGRK